jgi:tetratricopeptide (TPR) repeat protein
MGVNSTIRKLSLILGLVILAVLATATYAESPREQLQQMTKQLQKSPNDSALREKIIKLAQEIKPAPAVPEEAERFEGRAQFAFKNAKSPADYMDAAKEYEKAIAVAPWVPGYYSDLCTIYEKAEKYAEAKKNCGFFLASSPSAQDASDVRKRIAGLEFAMEKVSIKKTEENSPEVRAAKERDRDKALLRSLDGARYSYEETYQDLPGTVEKHTFDIRGIDVVIGSSFSAGQYQRRKYPSQILDKAWAETGRYTLNGRQFITGKGDLWICKADCPPTCTRDLRPGVSWECPMTGTISDDGNFIEFRGNGSTAIFRRER